MNTPRANALLDNTTNVKPTPNLKETKPDQKCGGGGPKRGAEHQNLRGRFGAVLVCHVDNVVSVRPQTTAAERRTPVFRAKRENSHNIRYCARIWRFVNKAIIPVPNDVDSTRRKRDIRSPNSARRLRILPLS